MNLVLQIVGEVASGLSETAKTFDTAGGIIGRSADCDWPLPDPDQHLSRHHCEITFGHGRFLLTDTSSNGVFVNGAAEPLGLNNSYELNNGDRITLGGYQLEARIVPDQVKESPSASSAGQADPLDLDDLLGPGPFRSDEQLKWEGDLDPARDGDPFGLHSAPAATDSDLLKSLDPAAEHPLRPATDPTAEWLGPAASDHTSSLNQAFPAPSVAGNPIPDDWDPGLIVPPAGKEEPPHTAQPEAAARARGPREAASPALPVDWDPGPLDAAPTPDASPGEEIVPPVAEKEPSPPPPGPAPPQPRPSAAPAAVGDDAAWLAFLRGAQIETLEGAAESPEAYMFAAGQIFRAMIEGLRDVLQARAALKNEFRVERTVLRAAENNPLKFSVDLDEAIKAILQSRGRGYMPGPRAVEEGFQDLKVHQLAVMAGMQEALAALLAAFDPAALTKRLDKESRFLSFLPGAGSRYWEAYEKHYREIAKDAENSFRGILGETFARAYEESSHKLSS